MRNLPCRQYVNGVEPASIPTMREYDPYAYETHEDPYPDLRRAARARARSIATQRLGFWALSRHADVLAAFRDIARFSNRDGVSLDPGSVASRGAQATMSFLAMDPPRHTRMRALVSRGFTPRRIADLEPRVRELATPLHRSLHRRRPLRLHPRLRRPAADGRDQRDARRAGGRSRHAAWHGPTRSCIARTG